MCPSVRGPLLPETRTGHPCWKRARRGWWVRVRRHWVLTYSAQREVNMSTWPLGVWVGIGLTPCTATWRTWVTPWEEASRQGKRMRERGGEEDAAVYWTMRSVDDGTRQATCWEQTKHTSIAMPSWSADRTVTSNNNTSISRTPRACASDRPRVMVGLWGWSAFSGVHICVSELGWITRWRRAHRHATMTTGEQ